MDALEEKRMLRFVERKMPLNTIIVLFVFGLIIFVITAIAHGEENGKQTVDNKRLEETIQRLREKISEHPINGDIPNNIDDQRIAEQIQRIMKNMKSARQINELMESTVSPETSNDAENGTGKPINGDERLYVAISSSMPVITIRRYLKELEVVGGNRIVLIMNGFVENDLKKTLGFLQNVKKIDPECRKDCRYRTIPIHIDPTMFEKHDVEAVPAFILCRPDGNPKIKLVGDVSVNYVAEAMLNHVQSPLMENIKETLR